MVPFVPHIANECLELMNCENLDKWPKIDKTKLSEQVKLAVQINGKTRDIIEIKKDLLEKDIKKLVSKNFKTKNILKIKKYLD